MIFCFVYVVKFEKGCLMKKIKLNVNWGGKRIKILMIKSDNVIEYWSYMMLNELFFFYIFLYSNEWNVWVKLFG